MKKNWHDVNPLPLLAVTFSECADQIALEVVRSAAGILNNVRDGSRLQFNIFDSSVLHGAQTYPERYDTLQVRICGWNVRFNDLDRETQETFIAQAEHL